MACRSGVRLLELLLLSQIWDSRKKEEFLLPRTVFLISPGFRQTIFGWTGILQRDNSILNALLLGLCALCISPPCLEWCLYLQVYLDSVVMSRWSSIHWRFKIFFLAVGCFWFVLYCTLLERGVVLCCWSGSLGQDVIRDFSHQLWGLVPISRYFALPSPPVLPSLPRSREKMLPLSLAHIHLGHGGLLPQSLGEVGGAPAARASSAAALLRCSSCCGKSKSPAALLTTLLILLEK